MGVPPMPLIITATLSPGTAVERRPLPEDLLIPACKRVSEVAVSDSRIELAEVTLVGYGRLGNGAYDQLLSASSFQTPMRSFERVERDQVEALVYCPVLVFLTSARTPATPDKPGLD